MKKKIIILTIVVLLLFSLAGYKLYINSKNDGKIRATGTIEVTKVDITPEVYGYLEKLNIDTGMKVNKGMLGAILSRPDLKAAIKRDEAGLMSAQKQLLNLERGAREQEIRDALANESALQAAYILADKNLVRTNYLYKSGAIAEQALDKARSDRDAAFEFWQASIAKKDLVEAGFRQDLIEAQKMEVERNKAVLEATKSVAEYTKVFVPADGVILSKNFEQGEYVNAGAAIATIGVVDDCWVKVYISADLIGKIKVGDNADIKIDSFPDKIFKGWVKEIGQKAEFTPRQTITPKERSVQVFYVKVEIENADGVMKPGMPADVIF